MSNAHSFTKRKQNMKITSFLLTAATVLTTRLCLAQEATNNENVSSIVLSNGALLSTEFVQPQQNETYTIPDHGSNTTSVSLVGSASVELGVPDVTYIYVIDNSGSTSAGDGDCGNVLECMQKFVYALHQEAVSDGSASMVAVINFDYDVTISADLQPITENATAIQEAIFSGYPDGENYCQDALNMAADLVNDERNTARTSVVIFVGDGECSTCGKGCPIDEDYKLNNTNAIVHSVAVGESVTCKESLNDIPVNGGRCTSVTDPEDLPHYVDELIGSDLLKVEMKVNNNTYEEIPSYELSGSNLLPTEAPIKTNFNVSVDLPVGTHEVCIRATGDDSLGDVDTVGKCKIFFVEAFPPKTDRSSNSEAGIAAAVVVVVLLVVFLGGVFAWRRGRKRQDTKEDVQDPNDYKTEASGEVC